jgi:putative restriction endonuclease
MAPTAAIEALYRLNTGVVGTGSERHERPHKPVLLLTAFDALATGRAKPDRIEWTAWLRRRFQTYFEEVGSHDDRCTPEFPFFHLRGDGFWRPFIVENSGSSPLMAPPKVRDADIGRVFARFIDEWDTLVANPVHRSAFRDALISTYFPHARARLTAHFIEPGVPLVGGGASVEDESPIEGELPGRNAAFRRRVIEVYDYQCVACGLRIWLPEHELTFVDAAHLVPFSETRNDHPTNGLSLCKNHHWALDQRLIAPDPTRVWRVSRHVEPRRSRGEDELSELAGQPLLAPVESAFAPDPRGLQWRFERLLR